MHLSDLRNPVISALRWTAASRLLIQLVTWSATIAAARILSPTDYGIVGVATLLSGYLALLGEVGFGSAIIQRQIKDSATLNAIFTVLLLSGMLLFTVTFLSAPLVAELFHEPKVVSVAQLVALQFLLFPFGSIPDAQLRMQLRFKELGIANFAGALMSAISVIGIALLEGGPFALIGAYLLSLLVRTLLINWFSRTPVRLTLNLNPTRSLLRYSGLIVVERSAWYWYSEADGGFVGKLLGSNALGIFSLAKNIAQAPLDRLAEVLNAVSFPAYSRIQGNSDALSEAYIKALRIGAYVVFPLFWGLGSVAEALIQVAFGEKWLPAILPLQLLSIAMPLRALQSISTPLMHAIGRPAVSLTTTLIALSIVLPFIYFGVTHFGVAGAAGGWACGFPIAFLVSSSLFARTVKIKPTRVWKVLIKPIACGVGMSFLVTVVSTSLRSQIPHWLTLLIAISTGAIGYIGFMALLDMKSLKELLGLVSSIAGRKAAPNTSDDQQTHAAPNRYTHESYKPEAE